MGASFPIVIDHRERAGPLPQILRRDPAFETTLAHLPLGDYLIDERFLVERKTLPDLTQSIKDGRLFRQALRLIEAEPRGVVLLEGTGGDLARSAMSREAIQGALITLTVFFGLPLLRARDAAESARLLGLLARQGRAFAEGAVPRQGKRPKNRRALQLHLLQGLPGIGPTRAARLLERFGSVEAVFAAESALLTETDGIGEETARRIRWAVREAAAGYCVSTDVLQGDVD
ncbi:ERCC4 domain-containing protein [Endothiovibrio diazotrophicus]